MAKERDAYRPILESLLDFMAQRGGGHVMTIRQVSEFTGRSPRTAAKHFGITKAGITVERLAMLLSAL